MDCVDLHGGSWFESKEENEKSILFELELLTDVHSSSVGDSPAAKEQ